MKMVKTRMYTSLPEMWEGWTKNIYLGLRDQPYLMALGVFGAFLAVITSLFLPAWLVLGFVWYANDESWMAIVVIIQSILLWTYLISTRARVAVNMEISPWYAFTTPLGAGVFAAMMFTSAWKVLSGQGVSWRGRKYHVR